LKEYKKLTEYRRVKVFAFVKVANFYQKTEKDKIVLNASATQTKDILFIKNP